MPAEFAPHEGCLMIWPERGDSWQYGAYAARKAFLRVIETISESESMTVLCSEGQYDNARAPLPDRVRLVVMATDDAWARDVGPTFVVNSRGERRGIHTGDGHMHPDSVAAQKEEGPAQALGQRRLSEGINRC